MSRNGQDPRAVNGHWQAAPSSAPNTQSPPVNDNPRRRTVRDYQFGTRIGEGSYSTVYLAVDLYNKKTYAVKMLSKKHIVQEGKIKYVNIEKTTLHRLGVQHPGIVQLYYTFQDELSLFFVLDFAEYGELLSIISKFGSLLESVLKFYMLQILDAVKFIHLKGVIHRDLKPENILVGYDFNLKITDFGTAKLIGDDEDSAEETITYDAVNADSQNGRTERKGSFVGTAEYVPPELLKFNICGFETDIWAIACILFQFFNGTPPFKGATEYLTFEKIININYAFREQVPPLVKEIIEKILVFEPLKRPTISMIQDMNWFKGVPWNNREYIWNRKVPRFEPYNHAPASSPVQPTFKMGANRNFNKSNSNYQLHSQIQKFDNLIPSIASKPLYVPATRIKKAVAPQGASNQTNHQFSPQNNIGNGQQGPSLRPDPSFSSSDYLLNAPGSPVRGQLRLKPNQAAFRHMAMNPNIAPPKASAKAPLSPQLKQGPPQIQKQSNSYIAAQQASAAVVPLEKSLAETKITGPTRSPEMNNLRANTAFASLPKQSSTKVITPVVALPPKPSPTQLHSSPRPTQPKAAAPASAPPKLPKKAPVTITLKEISSFLGPDEKIVKLDSVMRLVLSNKLIDRKPGNLDDETIEKLIDRHKATLNERMMPVIACISNKAKVFLIDERLDVMMVDLTANKGGDYLMYDYEFESEIVSDEEEDWFDTKKSDEVFGYLILELIKEGGDLIFLKRFSDKDKADFSSSIKVVGANGDNIKIGANFGWIDCLIWAKDVVDKEMKLRKTQGQSIKSPQQSQKPFPTKQTSNTAKPSKVVSSKTSGKQKPKPGTRSANRSPVEESADSKTTINKFAYAAAAAAHK